MISNWVGNTKKKIDKLTREIDPLQEIDDNTLEVKNLEKKLEKLLVQEEVHW